ncbi:aminotransferase [Clostridia bacterium]|nr:aminotransferase [Clostridia bacterium]
MYTKLSKEKLAEIYKKLESEYTALKAAGHKLDMSRGKPGPDQLDLTNDMLTHCLDGDYISEEGIDCRNYGVLDGLIEAKRLFMPMLGVNENELIIGGNSSLQLMYDTIAKAMLFGVLGKDGRATKPWCDYSRGEHIKFLCPCPGYDRHFAISESMGMVLVPVPMNENGPDMDIVEKYVENDPEVKGIWCVPLYSNPGGVSYSDETVRRFAALRPMADNFRIFWDNAYAVHHLSDDHDTVLNILDEAKKLDNENVVYIFSSTSKISYPGGGLAVVAGSAANIAFLKHQMSFQTIGFDKLNQLRHAKFFGSFAGIEQQMLHHKAILKPKFDLVLKKLSEKIEPLNAGTWHEPRGGYFVSFDGRYGTAARTTKLCKDAGLVITGAGAAYPYGKDPDDANLRIAPTYPNLSELDTAMDIFCLAEKMAFIEAIEKYPNKFGRSGEEI